MQRATPAATVDNLSVRMAARTVGAASGPTDVPVSMVSLARSARETTGRAPALLRSTIRCVKGSSVASFAPRPSAAPPSVEPGATLVSSVPPSHTPADEALSLTFAPEPAKMWMSAKLFQVYVPGETASTPWAPTSVNVPLAIVKVRPATSVKISMSAAASPVCATVESARTLLAATCAPVREATSPARTAPDVLINVWAPVSLPWRMAGVPLS